MTAHPAIPEPAQPPVTSEATNSTLAGFALQLGLRLLFDDGDLEVAVAVLTTAAHHGSAEAMYHLGNLFDDGEDEEWLTRAADQGYAPAMTLLGHLAHENGDLRQACTWWIEAALHGEYSALDSLDELVEDLLDRLNCLDEPPTSIEETHL